MELGSRGSFVFISLHRIDLKLGIAGGGCRKTPDRIGTRIGLGCDETHSSNRKPNDTNLWCIQIDCLNINAHLSGNSGLECKQNEPTKCG